MFGFRLNVNSFRDYFPGITSRTALLDRRNDKHKIFYPIEINKKEISLYM